jgi:two-component system, chemotaxis family, protein-glutamate methylesterase/glutaminase
VTTAGRGIRVVVVEDSLVQRSHLVAALAADGDITVVGEATGAGEAAALVERLRPDVVTLDLQIPDGGGLAAVERIMAFAPTPILILSGTIAGRESQAAVAALVAGALDAVPKPARWTPDAERDLRDRVRLLGRTPVIRHPKGRLSPTPPVAPPSAYRSGGGGGALVGIAASTGGPQALATVLGGLGLLSAAVLVVQHLHPDFLAGFVSWMDRACPLPVVEAVAGAPLRPGIVHVGPVGVHLKVDGSGRHVVLDPAPATLHRPSANELFTSIARSAGPGGVGVVLTGMGDDGASGLLALRRAGGRTIAQDEATSAVYGMPKAAVTVGAVAEVVALGDIAAAVQRAVRGVRR